MNMAAGQLLIAGVIVSILQLVHGENVIFCYYGTWAYYRNGNGKFTPNEINPQLCTHIGYSFFGIAESGEIQVLDSWLDLTSGLGNIANTIALKEQNPELKVVAAVGGWNEGSVKYSAMAANATKRATFISSSVQFIQEHGFDGLDLDWEYPAQRGGSSSDRVNFVTLLKELKEALSAEGLTLSIAVAAAESSASISYDIPNVAAHVDFINVMSYDFSGSWNSYTGHNAPLAGSDYNNVNAAIEYWLQEGAPSNKLVLGIAIYGRTFTLADTTQNAPGSPSSGPGLAGPYTYQAGVLTYAEICEGFSSNSWNIMWDEASSVPYAVKDNQWISYDNEQSVMIKVDYIKSLNLRGAMLWSLEQDDIHGFCGSDILLAVIHRELQTSETSSSSSTSTSTTASTSSSTTSSTSSTSAPTVSPTTSTESTTSTTSTASTGSTTETTTACSQNGTFQHPDDCSRFYMCSSGIRYDYQCPTGLHYDEVQGVCNWPSAVGCKSNGTYHSPVVVANRTCY